MFENTKQAMKGFELRLETAQLARQNRKLEREIYSLGSHVASHVLDEFLIKRSDKAMFNIKDAPMELPEEGWMKLIGVCVVQIYPRINPDPNQKAQYDHEASLELTEHAEAVGCDGLRLVFNRIVRVDETIGA